MADALMSFNATEAQFDTVTAANTTTSAGVATANATSGTGVLPTVVLLPGVQRSTAAYGKFAYNGALTTSGTGTVAFAVQAYFANPRNGGGAGWYTISNPAQDGVALTTTAGDDVRYVPFTTDATKVRGVVIVTGTGAALNVVGDVVFSRTTP